MCAMNPRLLRPLATGFNPKSIAGLGMWLDASNTSSLTFNGSTVSEWRDLSGNDRHVSQATPGLQPTGDNRTQNGRRVLDFDGGDQLLGNAASMNILRNVPGGTVMAVLAYDVLTSSTLSPTPFIISSGSNQNQARQALASVAPNTGTIGTGGRRLDANSFASINAAYTAATPVVITSVLDYANSDAFLYFDGSEVATSSSFQTDGNTSNTDSVAVAVGSGVSLNYFNGFIGEILVWPRVLTAAERQKAEGYLAWKWGLEGSLPTNHPYAYSFPGLGSQPRPSNLEALDWISGVIAAGSSVNTATANAVDAFVSGCKADGIWDAIKACCILCGPETLAGALVPLVGAAPTNNGPFVSGDYNRKTGLKGNGTTKDLAFPFDGSTVGQDDYHLGVYAYESGTSGTVYAAHGRAETGASSIAGPASTANNLYVRCRNSVQVSNVGSLTYPGYVGVFRTDPAVFVLRTSGTSNTYSRTSQAPPTAGTNLFNVSTGASIYSDVRLSFFSSGEYIDPATLESRVNALIAAIGAAIP